jgi:TfoX/Sxy family transcriptional regulator of competence genes
MAQRSSHSWRVDPMPISQDVLDLYNRLIATQSDVRRKGASMPYTSVNGHMFSFLTADGHLALRLPAAEREAFLGTYQTNLVEQYGKVMKEYVDVPDSLLRDVDELAHHFRTSYTYVSSLKPKPTTRRSKTSSAQTPRISAYADAKRSGS